MSSSEPGRLREYVWLPTALVRCTDGPREAETEADHTALVESIRRRGILHPILVADRKSCEIVAGRRRYRAALAAGLEHVPCMVLTDCKTDADRVSVMLDENLHRVGLTQAEQVALSERLRPALKREAARRQKASQLDGKTKAGKPKRKSVGTPRRGVPKGTVNEQLGQATGRSAETERKQEAVARAAHQAMHIYGDLYAQMQKGTLTVHAAYSEMKRREAKLAQADAACQTHAAGRQPQPEAEPERESEETRADDAATPATTAQEAQQPSWVAEQVAALVSRIHELDEALVALLRDGHLSDAQQDRIYKLLAKTLSLVE